jgi:hypothetical protein
MIEMAHVVEWEVARGIEFPEKLCPFSTLITINVTSDLRLHMGRSAEKHILSSPQYTELLYITRQSEKSADVTKTEGFSPLETAEMCTPEPLIQSIYIKM